MFGEVGRFGGLFRMAENKSAPEHENGGWVAGARRGTVGLSYDLGRAGAIDRQSKQPFSNFVFLKIKSPNVKRRTNNGLLQRPA
jgi:hypothetical protein